MDGDGLKQATLIFKRQRASQVVPFATTNTQKNRARIHLCEYVLCNEFLI